jgi:hypothetical protein
MVGQAFGSHQLSQLLGGRSRRIMFQGHPRQKHEKSMKPYLKNNLKKKKKYNGSNGRDLA